jgi:hypothetical protein
VLEEAVASNNCTGKDLAILDVVCQCPDQVRSSLIKLGLGLGEFFQLLEVSAPFDLLQLGVDRSHRVVDFV